MLILVKHLIVVKDNFGFWIGKVAVCCSVGIYTPFEDQVEDLINRCLLSSEEKVTLQSVRPRS